MKLIAGKNYQMTVEEWGNLERFMAEAATVLDAATYSTFEKFVERLVFVQNPNKRDYPFIDNLMHGIEVARICLRRTKAISLPLLLAAVGHDWDRACGTETIKSSDYANDDAGNAAYKQAHAENSARLFRREMSGYFDEALADKVYELVLSHEVGGEGDLAILDFADAMVFFSPETSGYYRLGRKYSGAGGEKLSGEELEAARKQGFAIKVDFMTRSMSPEDLVFTRQYVGGSLGYYDEPIKTELKELLDLD